MKKSILAIIAAALFMTACSSVTDKQEKELADLEYELRKAVLEEAITKTKSLNPPENQL